MTGKKQCLVQGPIGFDEQTLAIRVVEVTSSDIADVSTLADHLIQVHHDQEIASVAADGPYDRCRRHGAIAAWVLMPSFRCARMPSRGRPTASGQQGNQNTTVERSGDVEVNITVDVAQRPK
jgi:hypothetical protein